MAKSDKAGIILIVLIVIMVAFGSYVFFKGPKTMVEDNYQYSNGDSVFSVMKISDIESYITLFVGKDEQQPYTLALRNDPLSLEDIPVRGILNTRIYGDEEVFVTIHPDANLSGKVVIAALEIDRVIDNKYLYNTKVSSATTLPYEGYPTKTCKDGTKDSTVVWLTLGSETTVYTEGNCIIVAGTDEDEIIRAADRFVLTLLGIMK